jgi:hypothetical protein
VGSKRLPTTSGTGKTGKGLPGFGDLKSEGMPTGVVISLGIPPSYRGLSQREVERRLRQPHMLAQLIPHLASSIVEFYNKPTDYKELVRNLSAQIDASE